MKTDKFSPRHRSDSVGVEATPSARVESTSPDATGRRSDAGAQPLQSAAFDVGSAAPRVVESMGLRSSARQPDEAPASALTLAEMRAIFRANALARAEDFPVEIVGMDPSATPPRHDKIWVGQVLQVLAAMPSLEGLDRNSFMPPFPTAFQPGYDEQVPEIHDTPFTAGVQLTAEGRDRLAQRFARTHQVAIRFHDESTQLAPSLVSQILESGRGTSPGRDVRLVHHFDMARKDGRNEHHGSLAIYIREGEREGLLLCDSTHKGGDLELAAELARACKACDTSGNGIPVYLHAWSVQHDQQSCWTFALKAAVALTGRRQTGPGGTFSRPDLLGALEARRAGPGPVGVVPVWSLPELARMGQSMRTIASHAGPEIDELLPGRSVTLRESLEASSYATRGGDVAPHYLLGKGESYALRSDILEINEQIRKHVDVLWTPPREDEFITRLTDLVRSGVYVTTTHDRIRDLEESLSRPRSSFESPTDHRNRFVSLVHEVYTIVESEQIEIPDDQEFETLARAISPHDLDECSAFLVKVIEDKTSLLGLAEAGAAFFARELIPRSGFRWVDPPKLEYLTPKFREDLRLRIRLEQQLLQAVLHENRFQKLLALKPGGAAVAGAIDALRVGEPGGLHAVVGELMRSIDDLVVPVRDEDEAESAELTDDDVIDDQFLRAQLTSRLEARVDEIQRAEASDDSDDDD